jgi:hypothetical protein
VSLLWWRVSVVVVRLMRVLVPFEGRVLRLLVGSFVHFGGGVARRLSSALL